LPFGRPRCEHRITVRAPCASAYSIVGSDDRIRVSSPIVPFLIGTLKSTRISTRRRCKSRSSIVFFFFNNVIRVLRAIRGL
jgi:hypothetical protein